MAKTFIQTGGGEIIYPEMPVRSHIENHMPKPLHLICNRRSVLFGGLGYDMYFRFCG